MPCERRAIQLGGRTLEKKAPQGGSRFEFELARCEIQSVVWLFRWMNAWASVVWCTWCFGSADVVASPADPS
eukprot:11858859-Alexandrium_andersonii.AAC.1